MRVGNSKTVLFSGAMGRKILVPFLLVRKVRRRLMGFWGPLLLSLHPQELSWDLGGRRRGGLGAGTTLLQFCAQHCIRLECC
jgi:hypothetical protein